MLRVSTAGGRCQRARRPAAVADPRARGLSVAAAAVIAHEVGHAVQDHNGEPAMALRQAIVPAAQFGSGIAPWLIIAGVWFQLTGLAIVGLIGFAAAVLFTFATLPVEIGASGKALAFVNTLGLTRRAAGRRARRPQGRRLDLRRRRR